MKNKRQEEIKNTIRKASKCPCVLCGRKADAVGSFDPEEPESMGMTDDQAIYFPVCTACLKNGLDLDYLEKSMRMSFGMPVIDHVRKQ